MLRKFAIGVPTIVALSSPATPDTRSTPTDASGLRPRQGKRTQVSWYASLLIIMTLLLAAGWELWRWLVLIITLD